MENFPRKAPFSLELPSQRREEDTLCKFPGVLHQPSLRRLDPPLGLDFWKPRPKRRPHDSIARPAIELRRVIAFVSWGWAGCMRRRPAQFQAPPGSISSIGRIRRPKSFHFLREPHVMFHISRIKARMCLRVSASQIWPATLQKLPSFISNPFPPPLPPPPFLPSPSICALFILLQPRLVFVFFSSYLSFSLSPPSRSAPQRRPPVRSLGSAGSETVTQSSLVIGHGHANQTGRNLQLIRILPPAIIVPSRLNPPPREN